MKTYTGRAGIRLSVLLRGEAACVGRVKAATEYIFDVTSDRKTTFRSAFFW